MISLFVIFACEDSKKLLPCFRGAVFQFYVEKCPQDAEDVEDSELCGSAPPHPVRCSARTRGDQGRRSKSQFMYMYGTVCLTIMQTSKVISD